jgi:hypothetical protein
MSGQMVFCGTCERGFDLDDEGNICETCEAAVCDECAQNNPDGSVTCPDSECTDGHDGFMGESEETE